MSCTRTGFGDFEDHAAGSGGAPGAGAGRYGGRWPDHATTACGDVAGLWSDSCDSGGGFGDREQRDEKDYWDAQNDRPRTRCRRPVLGRTATPARQELLAREVAWLLAGPS
jgi:hypothetical protein